MNTHKTPTAESVEELAKQVFTELHQAIILNEPGSLDGAVDSIHDMRVAVRRMRVALSNFAVIVPKEDRKRLRSQLENLANALGNVRDLDVMIATIKPSLLARSNVEKSASAPLIRRLRARRRFRLRGLRTYLRGEEYADFKRAFLSAEDNLEIMRPPAESSEIPSETPETPEIMKAEAIGEGHGQAA
jgi:CHAD domain-containing protein